MPSTFQISHRALGEADPAVPQQPQRGKRPAPAPQIGRATPLMTALARALGLTTLTALLAIGVMPASAQGKPGPAAPAKAAAPTAPLTGVTNSALDAQTFYQLLISELELRRGEPGVAYQVMLDAAKRTRDDLLFKRAVDMAISAQAAEQALAALKQWRQTLPKSRLAAEMQAQALMALGKPSDAVEPMRTLIELTPAADRSATIAALPGLVVRGSGASAAATAVDEAIKPWLDASATRVSALLASSRSWLAADGTARALGLAEEAQKLEPGADAAAYVGLELFGQDPRAEALATRYAKTADAAPGLQLLLARRLTTAQRYREALEWTAAIVARRADFAPAWLLQGALQIEVGQSEAARTALTRYLSLKDSAPGRDDEGDDAAEAHQANDDQERTQAVLMLAQASEQLKDYDGAQQWLERLGGDPTSSAVVLRRASLLARQGKLAEGRALIQAMPVNGPDEARAKVMAETQLLRDARQWDAAYQVLVDANRAWVDDPDLLYEQALLAEKLHRYPEMEQLLRRVIVLKPDQQHAYNALGFSLADRGERLEEAHKLVAKALELAPGDPFITDSLAWVEYKLGRGGEALKLLQSAYGQRPDVEIGAHLGEVLWSLERRDEAMSVWRASRDRDAANEVLAETLSRLKVAL
ncbi:MAG: hypothetical protein AB9M60_13315 [Leptothrix sp. (in: b-proteobacteria)]